MKTAHLLPYSIACCISFGAIEVAAAPLPIVSGADWQPLAAQVERVVQALDAIGEPCTREERAAIDAALSAKDPTKLQAALDGRCLFGVNINAEMRVKVQQGPARPELVEQGWRSFLVKVHNEAGTTAALEAASPNALTVYERAGNRAPPPSETLYRDAAKPPALEHIWLDLSMYDKQPLRDKLGGLALEYRIVQIFGRDAGKREGKIAFNAGQGTQDLGFRNEVDVLFNCAAAHPVRLSVTDERGVPTMASFLIRDAQQRVYPLPSKRLEPDFFFQPQVYRSNGETIKLPAGRYTIEMSRGPESRVKSSTLLVPEQKEARFQVERWIDPAKMGWWSGDHHIHAAGCAHYVKPTEGVLPAAMMRHVLGEDLKVGANLTWGPGFDYQKQFFCGDVDKVSLPTYLLRYDVEVSQFGSHRSGHLVLLRLKEQMYPGGDSKHHWPTLGLNTLRWAKRQGAVVGPAHSGNGLYLASTTDLPHYIVPAYDGIGANEYVMNVTHEVPGPDGRLVPAVDFTSTVDTNFRAELNMWYHTLNAGFRTRISGETDFPCISGERVGMGRSYVKLDGKLDYNEWCEGIRQGRAYVTEGKSHLLEFKVNDVAMGEKGSELRLARPGTVRATVKVAALLDETPKPSGRGLPWNIERARIGQTREVPVELIVNGYPVARQTIVADGSMREVSFEAKIERSSWVAVRILPSSHANPVFVLVGDKPIRASRRSVEWCLKGVDQCWSQKKQFYAAAEMEQAKADFEYARQVYRKRLAECEVE